ncbi:MAG: protein kinase [Thermoanaerobaculia bacterium]|jgi:hypothetical protein
MPIQPGNLLGPYEMIAPIGAGGMGEVWRARDPRIGRDVAIKILPPGCTSNPDRLARFVQEAKTTGSLNHPSLLVIFDFGTHEDVPYLVSELLEGETLRQRLDRDAVPARKAIDWATQIAEGVAAAHEKGVIHRDIKPENIFLTRDERVKLLDFGLAKLTFDEQPADLDGDTHLRHTDPGSVLGTPGYMAPEQVRGEAVDERADIFALGIVVTEMVTGANPFRRATRVETMTAILQNDVALPDSVPPGFARIIDHMLAKHPGSRFQSMKDVAFALRLLSGSGASGEIASQSGSQARVGPASDTNQFLSVTFRRGRVGTARFTPEGSIVYGAAWEGNPLELFVSYPGTPEARPIGLVDADLLSVSPTGELGVSLGRRFIGGWVSIGTLAKMPLAGGAPRKICEQVVDADWAPDGKNFAIVRHVASTFVLEYPIGRRLYASGGWLSHVRFSRDGTRLAFIEHPWFGDDAGRPIVIDLEGGFVMEHAEPLEGTSGLTWSPDGSEVWIAGSHHSLGRDLFGFDMAGASRLVLAVPGELTIFDANPSGEFLISQDTHRREVYSARRGEEPQRNLAWFDWPMLTDISKDGSQVLIEEQKAGAESSRGALLYLRPTDGGPALHIGDGRARSISPDGNWVAAAAGGAGQLELIPTGVGESRFVRCDKFEQMHWWFWLPDGERILVIGTGDDQQRLCLCVPVDGSEPTPAGPGSFGFPAAISPDSARFVASGPDERLMIYPMTGPDGAPLKGARTGDWPCQWSADGRFVFVFPRGQTTLTVDRIDVETGERSPWQEIHPLDLAGILDINPVWLTPDGEHYAYSYRRCLSDLYLVSKARREG